jgi:hypothetical protein
LAGGDTSALTGAVGSDRAHAEDFYRRLALLNQQYQQQLAAQSGLGRQLDRQIAGTAPSVAQTQLRRGVGDIQNNINATTSGASGNTAALAGYSGIQALGAAQAKANADAAQIRAQEVAQAEQAKANLLAQQQAATGQQTATATGAGTALSGQAVSGGAALGNLNQEEIASERNLVGNVASGVGSKLISDEDEKEDISPVKGGDMDAFLKHVAGFNFEYKSKSDGPGKRVGVMAGDVKQGGPVGRAVSDGHEIDVKNALGALMAAVGHLNKKIESRA